MTRPARRSTTRVRVPLVARGGADSLVADGGAILFINTGTA
jgi:hypothetical protein